jgi:hypothetical protein
VKNNTRESIISVDRLNSNVDNEKKIKINPSKKNEAKYYIPKLDGEKIKSIFRNGVDHKELMKLSNDNKIILDESDRRKQKINENNLKLLKKFDYEYLQRQILSKEHEVLEKFSQGTINKNVSNLNNEICHLFEEDLELINPSKFTKIHRLDKVFNMSSEPFDLIHLEKLKKLSVDIDSHLQDIDKSNKMKKRKILVAKWKSVILYAAYHFKNLKLDISNFFKWKSKNFTPFSKTDFDYFMKDVKEGDEKSVKNMLNKNKFFIYARDPVIN